MTDEILIDREGPIVIVTLNRPKALNALTLTMCQVLLSKMTEWAEDPELHAVVLRGAGDRAFCAGGDIRAVYERGPQSGVPAGDPDQDFFWVEYRLNHAIHHFPKPWIALLDGVTMGGGLGLSVHGSHRVTTEKTLSAMPECGIGLFPDIGGGWFLSRCPGEIGTYLALTGTRIGAADMLFTRMGTHHIASAKVEDLIAALADAGWIGNGGLVAESVLQRFAADPGAPTLAPLRPAIDRCFGRDTVEEILTALDAEEGDWARAAAEQIRAGSPTSLKVTLRQIRQGKTMIYDAVAAMEFRMVHRFLEKPDFFEGVRAQLVDKTRDPKWRPATLAEVDDAAVAAYFQPLPGRELSFD
ncbi:enoyl-CoA hydratase/isomerase family protein [Inquilinus limosus]|uniref:enoyl-CoA hydratase/isomerase family protein n=1 Tax=Inquilinus limosus TaxID=171674 RepID=UPI003F1629FA